MKLEEQAAAHGIKFSAVLGYRHPAFPVTALWFATDAARWTLPEDRQMTPTALRRDRHTFAGSRVSDAMTTGLISCPPETPLRVVARIMARERVHAVYVFDYGAEDDETVELWGIVSDIDLVAAARGDLDDQTARDSSVTPLLKISSDEPLDRAAQLLAEHGVTHLAVLDPTSKRPCGVLSTLDVARVIANECAA
jgi:CBS domain-containing protein